MKKAFYLSLILVHYFVCSQGLNDNKVQFCDSVFATGLNEQEFPGLVCSYYSSDTSWIGTYGLAEWDSKQKVNESTLFQLGSIGKVITAMSALQLVEKGVLDLDEDISTYLDFKFDRIDKSPITLRNLLTHSAGLNDRNIGYFARDSSDLSSLNNHLQQNSPSFYQPAGIEINYSNYSYALVGYIVERVIGIPFKEYVQKHIFNRLGMNDSYIGFDFGYYEKSNYSKSHIRTDSGFMKSKEYARHALPAGSMVSNGLDMKKLLQAIVTRNSQLLSESSWRLLSERQFSNHSDLSGYSLGFEEQSVGDKTYWAKGGMLRGQLSQLILWPDSSAMFIAVNTNDDAFLEDFHQACKKVFLNEGSVLESVTPTDLTKYSGEYRDGRYDRGGVENIISLFRGAFYVWEGEEGLTVFHNNTTHTYSHIQNHIFQCKDHHDERMVFKLENGEVKRLYRNINIGGLNVPATYEPTTWYNSPTFINEYYGVVPLLIVLYGVSLLMVSIITIVRKFKPEFWKWRLLPSGYYWVAFLGVIAVIIHAMKALLPLVKSPMDFLFGLPQEFVIYNHLGKAIALLALISISFLVVSIVKNNGSVLSKILFGTFALAMVIHCWFLVYWNFV